MDLDVGFVHKILEGALHTLLQNVEDVLHVGMILRNVKEPGKIKGKIENIFTFLKFFLFNLPPLAIADVVGEALADHVIVDARVQIPEVLHPARVDEEHQAFAGEGVGQVIRVELGPNLVEVKLVRGHNQELVDQLVEEVDGRSTILKQEKWY